MFVLTTNLLPRWRQIIRLRMPASMKLFAGSNHERIDATFDEGGRIVQLIVHTKSRSIAQSSSRWF